MMTDENMQFSTESKWQNRETIKQFLVLPKNVCDQDKLVSIQIQFILNCGVLIAFSYVKFKRIFNYQSCAHEARVLADSWRHFAEYFLN